MVESLKTKDEKGSTALHHAAQQGQLDTCKDLCFVNADISATDNDGNTTNGKVLKLMRKFAKVDTGNAIWRVPMHALTMEGE